MIGDYRKNYTKTMLIALSILGLLLLVSGLARYGRPAGRASMQELPPALQSVISGRIGQDDAAFYFTPAEQGAVEQGGYTARYAARYAARNERHSLSVAVDGEGMSVQAGATDWRLALQDAPVGGAQAELNRLTVTRGAIAEWYVNGPSGLEQGWTVKSKPAGLAAGLALRLVQSGSLRAAPSASATELLLRRANGEVVLRYGGLYAYDAAGKPLAARFEVSGDQVRIQVDDRAARYPVTIDPYLQNAKLTASDKAASDNLGYSVAMSADGNVVAAGAYRADPSGVSDAGAVYVFEKGASAWGDKTQSAKLTASNKWENDNLGYSVDISSDGSVVVAGAPYADPLGQNNAGTAYVFEKGAAWANKTQSAKLIAQDCAAGDNLGYSVAISSDGKVVAAGAYRATVGGTSRAGAVYVFEKGGGWVDKSNSAKLTASDKAAYDYLGYSVTINSDGSLVASGAVSADVTGASNAGAVYVFVKGASWWDMTQSAKLTASDKAADDYLGCSVTTNSDGSLVASGAKNADATGANDAGAVYVFEKGTAWGDETQSAKLTASDKAASDNLGVSVAMSSDGGVIVAGAYLASPGGTTNAGAAYVFGKGAAWGDKTEGSRLTASDKAANDDLGYSVAINADGSLVASGAYLADVSGTSDAGAVYVFGPVTAPSTQASAVTFSNVQSTQMQVDWTNGSGAKRAVFVYQGSSGSAAPLDDTTYAADAAFGSGTQIGSSGWYCVYNDTGSSVTVTGLSANTTYRVMVTEYNGEANSEKYNTSTATNNPNNQTTDSTCTASGSGDWSAIFAGCSTPGVNIVIPPGATITLDSDVSISGDLEVQGTFVPNGKTVTLTGSAAQTLTGNPLITFYNLVINKDNKTDTVAISGKLKVTKKLTITKGKLVSASDYEDIEIGADGELELTSAITVGGNFTNSGTLTTNGNSVTFDGGKQQSLAANVVTVFDDLMVTSGTTLVETVSDDNVAAGTLTNNGVIRKMQVVDALGDYYFGLAGRFNSADLVIYITSRSGGNPLTAIQVDQVNGDHSGRTGSAGNGVGWGHYWTITPTGSDFTADVTLPHNVSPQTDAKACRYVSGTTWDCKQYFPTADSVTYTGTNTFSDWAVGDRVSATAITLQGFHATSQATVETLPVKNTGHTTSLLLLAIVALLTSALAWYCSRDRRSRL